MGVSGVGGRGAGARPPSHVAYYVALAGILGLLLMLLAYFACFCIKRVKDLVQGDNRSQRPRATSPPPPPTVSYPVQPIVRDSASAMAKLCRQLPAPTPVYPAASSPAARRPALADASPPDIVVHPPDLDKTPAPPPDAAALQLPAVR